jgi:hypothetical protein
MKWKAAIVGLTGEVHTSTAAFQLLYSFPTREDAEAHVECFRTTGTKLALCEVPETPADDSETKPS